MDDRFDMMLNSKEINASGGMECFVGSLKAIGNDGNHFNDSINSLPNTSVTVDVANALHYASDHIPISQIFIFPEGEKDTTVIAISNTIADEFNVYHNPVNTFLTIRGITSPTIPIINSTTIDLSDLQNGMYFLTGKSYNGISVKKVIKEGN